MSKEYLSILCVCMCLFHDCRFHFFGWNYSKIFGFFIDWISFLLLCFKISPKWLSPPLPVLGMVFTACPNQQPRELLPFLPDPWISSLSLYSNPHLHYSWFSGLLGSLSFPQLYTALRAFFTSWLWFMKTFLLNLDHKLLRNTNLIWPICVLYFKPIPETF